MYSKQNEKINQVTTKTLIVGIDIAKNGHVARAINDRGIILSKPFSFEATTEGFNAFAHWVKGLQYTEKKSKVLVGFEPTGHYWFTFANFLKENNLKYVVVNPMHVKKSKELDDNTPSKRDPKDAVVIAKLVKDGRYSYAELKEGSAAEIRMGVKLRHEFIDKSGRLSCQIRNWLDVYFPEFTTVFKEIDGKMALGVLRTIPLPEQINQLTEDQMIAILRDAGVKIVHRTKMTKLKAAAASSCGVRQGLRMALQSIYDKAEDLSNIIQKQQQLEKELQELVIQNPGVKEMAGIPGISLQNIVDLYSEIGDVRHFEHPRQILKYAGLNLKESSSGLHKGKTQISKRGRRKLRGLLYNMVLTVLRNQSAFKRLHEYYTTRKNNPLKKMQSLIVLIGKLVRVLFKIGTNGHKFDEGRLLKDIPHLNAA
ncbi:MAG: IS110 family transposase [Bacilli bacterium]